MLYQAEIFHSLPADVKDMVSLRKETALPGYQNIKVDVHM